MKNEKRKINGFNSIIWNAYLFNIRQIQAPLKGES